MDLWAYTNRAQINFSGRGKLTDNAVIESFNGRRRPPAFSSGLI
jgi:transposase InsO family protein